MGCCCGGRKSNTKSRAPAKTGPTAPNATCYLTFDNDEMFVTWANAPPEDETILATAKPEKTVAGFLKPPRLVSTVSDEHSFLKGIAEFVKEVSPALSTITLDPDAYENSTVEFELLSHQPGNKVIGDRVVHIIPGGASLKIDFIDAVAVISLPSDAFAERTMALEDFKEATSENGGCLVELDPSGRKPALII